MPDFNPDAFLAAPAKKPTAAGFDPDAYLAGRMGTQILPDAPSAEDTLREKEAMQTRIRERQRQEAFTAENVTDAPLRVTKGLPASKRARLSLESDLDMKADILKKDGFQVRKSKDGQNLIIRHEGEDVLLNPLGPLTGGDVAGAAFPIAKAAVGTAAAFATGGMSLPLQAGIMGASMGLTDAGGHLVSRGLAGQDAKGVAGEALDEATINAALPLAGGVVKAGTNAVRSRILGNVGELEKRLPDAAARLGVETTPAMRTGSPTLAKAGKLTPEEETLRQKALQGSQDRAIGPSGQSSVLSEEKIAADVKPGFADAEQAAKLGAEADMGHAERAAQRQIQAQLDSGLVPTTLPNSEVGKHVRGKFQDFVKKVEADAAKNYPAFHAQADAEQIVLDKAPITNLVKQIEKEDPTGAAELLAPSVRQVKSVEGALTKPLRKVDAATGEAVELPAPDLTFADAIRLRAIVRTKLNSPTDPMGDVVKSYYARLEKALTESIDDGLTRGSDDLRSLYETARGAYAKGADALDRGVVQKLFRDVGEAGRVPDEDVVRQLFAGRGKLTALRDMKNILDPQDYKLLLRGGLNELIGAESAGKQTVNAGAFLSKLNTLDEEVRKEVLGAAEQGLRRNLSLMQRAQNVQIPRDELEDAILGGGNAGRLLEQAIAREEQYQRVFSSSVNQKLRNGVVDAATGNDDRFVTWLMGPNVSVADTKQALTQIGARSPADLTAVRQRTMANVLDHAGVKAPTGKEGARAVFDSDSSKLDALLRSGSPEREKLTSALGPDGVQFLDDLADYAKAVEKMHTSEVVSPTSPGRLAIRAIAGGTMGAATGSLPLSGAGAIVGLGSDILREGGRKIGSSLVRKKAFERWLETGELPDLGGKLGRAAILSAPTIERAREAVVNDDWENMALPSGTKVRVREKK